MEDGDLCVPTTQIRTRPNKIRQDLVAFSSAGTGSVTEGHATRRGQSEVLPDSALDPHAVSPIAAEAPPGEAYVAQRGSRLFHQRDCGWVKRIGEPDRIYFKRVTEAKEAGFMACPSCEPWEPA